MSKEIAEQWLRELADTANAKNFAAHMALISRRISLHGVPGFETIGYDDWSKQCQHEFKNNVLKSVTYAGFKPVAETDRAVMFKTFESVQASDGTVNAQGIEILIEKEDDGKWRMVQQRILLDDETAHDQLLPQRVEH